MAAAANCTAGVVRLLNGVEGRVSGFGLAHLEAKLDRQKQLSALGFRSIHAYVRAILESFSFIACEADGRLALVWETGTSFHHLICQWDNELGMWSVTTAIPKRHARGLVAVWTR